MIQDPGLYQALSAAMQVAEDGTRALGLTHWQHLIASWNPNSQEFHLVLCTPGAERLMGIVSGLIDPGNDGKDPDFVAPPELAQLIEALREEEGATITLTADNPEFNDQPNAVIYVCGSWTNWEDLRLGGNSVMECLREAVRRKEAAGPCTQLTRDGADLRLREALRWQRQLTITELATTMRRVKGNIKHPDVLREVQRVKALDDAADAYGFAIEFPADGKPS